jgi:tetratricopeptide (TPR) repeat protein
MQPIISIRVSRKVAGFAVCLFALGAFAQESDSLGDIARRTRGQRERDSNEGGATMSQCSTGPISQGQILAWQISGISDVDIARSIDLRGVSFVPGAQATAENAFTLPIAAALARSARAAPENVESDVVLGNLLHTMESSKQNEYSKAIHAMQDVTRENQTSADFFAALASLYVRSRDLTNAARSYRQAAQLADNCIYIHRQLASTYSSLEDVENAEAEVRKMVALDPQSAETRKYVARAHALRMDALHEERPSGDGVDSSEYETDNHEPVSDRALHYNRTAIAEESQGNIEAAIQDYQRAIEAEPRWWGPRFNLGQTYRRLGRLQNAVEAYQGAKSLSPEHLNVRQNLGYCLCKLGRWNEAVTEFKEILEIDPTWNIARPCLYDALRALHRDAEAQQVLADDQKYKEQGYED